MGALQQIDLARGLIGPDIGVGAQGADLGHVDVAFRPGAHNVRMDAAHGLAAAREVQAGGLLRGTGAHQRGREQSGQGALARARRAAENVGVGEAPPGSLEVQLPFEGTVARQRVEIHPYTRSNRSMSTTKMVAPPTTTSTGMLG